MYISINYINLYVSHNITYSTHKRYFRTQPRTHLQISLYKLITERYIKLYKHENAVFLRPNVLLTDSPKFYAYHRLKSK